MKKTLSLILTLLMLAVPLTGHAEPAETGGAPERIVIDYDYEHLVVGNATPFNGSFFTGMWGALTSDLDVQRLIHGYNLVEWRTDRGGAYNIDPTVVSGIVVTQNQAGDRTFTFDIYSDLLYSDGTQITAWDYAFSWLLSMAPRERAADGVPEGLSGLCERKDGLPGGHPCVRREYDRHHDRRRLPALLL